MVSAQLRRKQSIYQSIPANFPLLFIGRIPLKINKQKKQGLI